MVAHHLELVLLPAGDAALDQDLRQRARGETVARRCVGEARSCVVRDAGAAAAEDERGPDDDGKADLFADAIASSSAYAKPDGGTCRPISVIATLNR